MSPLFTKKCIEEYHPSILHHSKTLLEKLKTEIGKPAFNIEKYLHRCVADFVNGTFCT